MLDILVWFLLSGDPICTAFSTVFDVPAFCGLPLHFSCICVYHFVASSCTCSSFILMLREAQEYKCRSQCHFILGHAMIAPALLLKSSSSISFVPYPTARCPVPNRPTRTDRDSPAVGGERVPGGYLLNYHRPAEGHGAERLLFPSIHDKGRLRGWCVEPRVAAACGFKPGEGDLSGAFPSETPPSQSRCAFPH